MTNKMEDLSRCFKPFPGMGRYKESKLLVISFVAIEVKRPLIFAEGLLLVSLQANIVIIKKVIAKCFIVNIINKGIMDNVHLGSIVFFVK